MFYRGSPVYRCGHNGAVASFGHSTDLVFVSFKPLNFACTLNLPNNHCCISGPCQAIKLESLAQRERAADHIASSACEIRLFIELRMEAESSGRKEGVT